MKRLYWTQPDTFETEVEVAVVDDRAVTIDPILFHPDEGGQPADLGTIGDASCDDTGGPCSAVPSFVGTYSVVPVPAAVWLFGSGLIGLVGLARRRS